MSAVLVGCVLSGSGSPDLGPANTPPTGAAAAAAPAAAPREDPAPPDAVPSGAPTPAGAPCPGPAGILRGPTLVEGQAAARLPPAAPEPSDKPLPINLATALRLAQARPILIAAAQASVQVAAAAWGRAKVLWLPSFDAGLGYYRHDGVTQGQSGNLYINTKDQFLVGAGLTAKLATTDALFEPLAARRVLRAREIDVQTARNDALLATAEAYFNVQQARGILAGTIDVVEKGRELGKAINVEGLAVTRPTNVARAMALLAEFEGATDAAREQWAVASADLTQVLRLDPGATVVPLEPPDLRVTLIAPDEPVDILIPVGLTNRPELASQQALVQAALARIRQEGLRPLVPSVILQGGPGPVGPSGYLMGGAFTAGAHGAGFPWLARDDISAGLVWELENLGLGNRALVRERVAEQRRLLVELFRTQDMVAAEIARSHGQLRGAAARVGKAENGLQQARLAYEGSLRELGKIDRAGDVGVLVRRAFEVIDALRSLSRAYDAYFTSVGDYNRAQFRLYRALGYPAEVLACQRPPGPLVPVDTTRPPPLPAVCNPVR
jgi:outer membrane protein TolC